MMGVPALHAGRVTRSLRFKTELSAITRRKRSRLSRLWPWYWQNLSPAVAHRSHGGSDRRASVGATSAIEGICLNGGWVSAGGPISRIYPWLDWWRTTRMRNAAGCIRLSRRCWLLGQLLADDAFAEGGEHRTCLTYGLIAEDAGWLTRIGDAIETGLTAEAAVQRVQNDIRARSPGNGSLSSRTGP